MIRLLVALLVKLKAFCFTAKPDEQDEIAGVDAVQKNKALRVAQMLVDAYVIAESDGGSVDWSDIDAAHALALEVCGFDADDPDDHNPAMAAATGKDAKNEPGIVEMMELSPLHLWQAEYQGLGAVYGLTAYPFTYGCFVLVPADDIEIHLLPRQEDGGPSDELISLIWYAYARGVQWIKFDRDVKPVSSLPVFKDSWV